MLYFTCYSKIPASQSKEVVRRENNYRRKGTSNSKDTKFFHINGRADKVPFFERETLTIDKDLLYLSNVCKRIRHVTIQVEYSVEILSETDEDDPSEPIELPLIGTQSWEPLQKLKSLESLTIKCYCWTDVYSLFSVVGKQLRFLKIEQRGYKPRGRFVYSQPPLKLLLKMCPNLEKLELDLEELKLSPADNIMDISNVLFMNLTFNFTTTTTSLEKKLLGY